MSFVRMSSMMLMHRFDCLGPNLGNEEMKSILLETEYHDTFQFTRVLIAMYPNLDLQIMILDDFSYEVITLPNQLHTSPSPSL